MDYARFNYVAQPEDSVTQNGLFPRIGDYDKWAIEWGYRWFPGFKTDAEEKAFLNKWVIDNTGRNKRLLFGTETSAFDPRYQNEDLGDNAMLAGTYGIKNLKRILPNLLQWTAEPDEDYRNAKTMYGEILSQYNRYLGHVVKNIGGIYQTPRVNGENGKVLEFVSRSTQREAMRFLHQQLFTTPTWLIDKKLFVMTGAGDMSGISAAQSSVLNRLLSNPVLTQLLFAESFDEKAAYTSREMLTDLKNACWTELTTNNPIDIYRRSLQKIYAERLINLVKPPAPQSSQGRTDNVPGLNKTNDALSLIRGHIKVLLTGIRTAIANTGDPDTKLHLLDLQDRLKAALQSE